MLYNIKVLAVSSLTMLLIIGCGGGGGSDEPSSDNPTPTPTVAPTPEPTITPEPTVTPEPTATPEPTTTPEPTATPEPVAMSTFNVAVQLPAAQVALTKLSAQKASKPATGLTNFEFVILGDNGEVVETIIVSGDDLVDNGDGTYQLSVEGDPRLDCILVAITEVNGNSVRLEIPAVDVGTEAEPVPVNVASTAATRQYIESVVEEGGFSSINDSLTIEEVDELIDTVIEQVSALIIPDDVDTDDINAVIDALENNAAAFVEAQIAIAVAPAPEAGSLAALAGDYHASLTSAFAFGSLDSFAFEDAITVADFTFNNSGDNLPGATLTVDESAGTVSLAFASEIETEAAVRIDGDNAQFLLDQALEAESFAIPGDIISSGEIFLNIDSDQADEGFLFDTGNEILAFISVDAAPRLTLLPWSGSAYVGSGSFLETEYRINDGSPDCANALGLSDEDLVDEALFEAAIESFNMTPNPSQTIIDNCTLNANLAEVLSLTMVRQGSDMSTADLAGTWGLVGLVRAIGDSNSGTEIATFNSELIVTDQGAFSQSNANDVSFSLIGQDLSGFSDGENASGNIAINSDGTGTFTVADSVDSDAFSMFVSPDSELMYLQFVAGDVNDTGTSGFGELVTIFASPLSSGHTASELVGQEFSLTGLLYTLELIDGSFKSDLRESLSGVTLGFIQNNGGDVVATFSGGSALTGVDVNLANGNRDIQYIVNEPVEENTTGSVSVEDNGAITIDISDDFGDQVLRGYIAANGNLLFSLSGTSAGMLSTLNGESSTPVGIADTGYVLGVAQ